MIPLHKVPIEKTCRRYGGVSGTISIGGQQIATVSEWQFSHADVTIDHNIFGDSFTYHVPVDYSEWGIQPVGGYWNLGTVNV